MQGQVVAVQPVADGTPGRVSLRFDKLVDRGKTVFQWSLTFEP